MQVMKAQVSSCLIALTHISTVSLEMKQTETTGQETFLLFCAVIIYGKLHLNPRTNYFMPGTMYVLVSVLKPQIQIV